MPFISRAVEEGETKPLTDVLKVPFLLVHTSTCTSVHVHAHTPLFLAQGCWSPWEDRKV